MNPKTKIINKKNRSYLCVENKMAGHKNVYTVYLIPSEQRSFDYSEGFDIIGRELDMQYINKYLTILDRFKGNVFRYKEIYKS